MEKVIASDTAPTAAIPGRPKLHLRLTPRLVRARLFVCVR